MFHASADVGLIVQMENRTYLQASYPLCSTEISHIHMNPSFSLSAHSCLLNPLARAMAAQFAAG